MLKKRLISALLLQDELLVQSFGFERYLPIGKAKIAVEFMTNWDIDEILLVDMTATREGRKPNLDLISGVSARCFVALTVGGGISEIADIQGVIRAGADKVCINKAALANPEFITSAAEVFGTQCVVVSIDVKRHTPGGYEVFSDSGTTGTGLDPVAWARRCEELGAGEILLNSIDRDGSREGYDLELVRVVSAGVRIPVIALGGVGTMKHFADGAKLGNASAVAAGNIFHHIEHSTIVAKSFLKKSGIDIRLSTAAKYTGFVFDDAGRILKKPDEELEQIWLTRSRLEAI
ncbi:MAG: imidazole glycerol phosphate synthase cyclase subunit [Chloroflexota bacterium]